MQQNMLTQNIAVHRHYIDPDHFEASAFVCVVSQPDRHKPVTSSTAKTTNPLYQHGSGN